jgi:hypothetical protein
VVLNDSRSEEKRATFPRHEHGLVRLIRIWGGSCAWWACRRTPPEPFATFSQSKWSYQNSFTFRICTPQHARCKQSIYSYLRGVTGLFLRLLCHNSGTSFETTAHSYNIRIWIFANICAQVACLGLSRKCS